MTEKVPLSKPCSAAPRGWRRTCSSATARSAFWLAGTADWRSFPDKAVIQAIGQPLVTGWPGDDGLWFFQTHYD
jgi:hypothetical protein